MKKHSRQYAMKLFKKHGYRANSGFTLIEVMVAITLLMIVILPLASLYVKSLSTIQGAALYSQALTLARSRMELVNALDYADIDYTNTIFCPGFPSHGPLLPYYSDYATTPDANMEYRDNPDTLDWVERYFNPTRSDGGSTIDYPTPIYRDYYNNFTGQLIDPNYNGLCDDDLNGDGVVDNTDRFIGNPNQDFYDTHIPPSNDFEGLDIAGDGVFDTVVEGMYANTFDQTMWRYNDNFQDRGNECVSPILDFGLLLDNEHLNQLSGGAFNLNDYRHREKTFANFVRMTTVIDPTPRLANPYHPDAYDDWVDQYYFWDRRVNDGYTDKQLLTLSLCLERDLPLVKGTNNLTIGVGGENVFDMIPDMGSGLQTTDPFQVNYRTPLYGKKVVVTVFYLSGEGEVIYEDLDGDGIPEEMPSETFASAKRVSVEKIYVNDYLLTRYPSLLRRDPSYSIPGVLPSLPGFGQSLYNIHMVPPQRRFIVDGHPAGVNTFDTLVIQPDIDAAEVGDPHDPCSEANDGLPYLGDRYWF
jgi:prepilin-type N-terminal cleavage/methylation domain-containing protein